MKEEYININLMELKFIIDNAQTMYDFLRKLIKNEIITNIEEEEVYVLTVLSLISQYRKNSTVSIKDVLLLFYTDIVKSIIAQDDNQLRNLVSLLDKESDNKWTQLVKRIEEKQMKK